MLGVFGVWCTGQVRWRQAVSSYRGLTVMGEQVFVVDDADHLLALDAKTGVILWAYEALAARALTAPLAVGDWLLVGDLDGYLHVFDQSGQLVGQKKIAGRLSSPLVLAKENPRASVSSCMDETPRSTSMPLTCSMPSFSR